MNDNAEKRIFTTRSVLTVIIFASAVWLIFYSYGNDYGRAETQVVVPLVNHTLTGSFKGSEYQAGDIEGLSHGRILMYLTAPIMSFFKAPAAVIIYFGILNILAMFLAYRAGKINFGPIAGIAILAFFAFNPMLIFYSRMITDKAVQILPIVLIYYSLFNILENRNNGISWFILIVSSAVSFQLHTQTVLLIMLLLPVLYFEKPKVTKLPLVSGLCIAVVIMMPTIRELFGSSGNFLNIINSIIEAGRAGESLVSPNDIPFIRNIFHECLYMKEYYFIFLPLYVFGLLKILFDSFSSEKRYLKKLFIAVYPLFTLLVITQLSEGGFRRYFTAFPAMAFCAGIFLQHIYDTFESKKSDHLHFKTFETILHCLIIVISVIMLISFFKIRSIENIGNKPDSLHLRENIIKHVTEAKGFCEKNLHNIHGPDFIRLMGDGGALFRLISSNTKGGEHSEKHLLIAKKNSVVFPFHSCNEYVSGYCIYDYEPSIDYSTLVYSYSSGIFHEYTRKFAPLEISGSDFPLEWERDWDSFPISFRGSINTERNDLNHFLFVSVTYHDERYTDTHFWNPLAAGKPVESRLGEFRIYAEIDNTSIIPIGPLSYYSDGHIDNAMAAFLIPPGNETGSRSDFLIKLSTDAAGSGLVSVKRKMRFNVDIFDLQMNSDFETQ